MCFTRQEGCYPILFTVGNPKTQKGEASGYMTAVLHLAPHTEGGAISVCPKSTPGCRVGCLYKAGRGGIMKAGETSNNVLRARVRRTDLYHASPYLFAHALHKDLRTLRRKAARKGLKLAVRINGTSDLPALARQLARQNPDVQFYDYTKILAATRSWTSEPNLYYTFSRSEGNEQEYIRALREGVNVAVVFGTKRGQDLPMFYGDVPVIDGDKHDLRFLDARGVIVGLRAKGPAKRDRTGFVVRE